MERLARIDEATVTADQRRGYDELMTRFGVIAGPFGVWLRSAELLDHGLKLQEMFASRVKLERRLLELALMVTARFVTAQFAWCVHEPHARKFGISGDILEAIRDRRTPVFTREDERIVYDIAMELNVLRSLSEANFQRGMAMFGEQVMVELVGAIGYYGMTALTLNAFNIPGPAGKKPLE
jgi:4-carboxymuconolactone decarboxylase